ncbi:hypothetical protein T440DRAFT_301313 [Plenodomus tracheiphilus IPT5]|uniref:Zn(2)-C6 fungal-type domain-containing protein n=1 Tax=Plenodomus tracheiphilus IPT5 TaxID=1408161 RepID=A0A6A7ARL6_9PLEO|nr:hypothetical protein T440DRAFT_301313 [Plenodomus tracheiphilus IPT5]
MANPSGTTALKLRDSCEACAASKVKCHKQKPTCSRCQRRGAACHYLATKRAGRRYGSQRVDSTQFSPVAASGPHLEHFDLDSWFGTSTTMASTHSSNDDIFLRQLLSPTASSIGTTSLQSSAVNLGSGESNEDMFISQSMSAVTAPCTPSNSLRPGSGVLSPGNLSMDIDDYLPSSLSLWAPRIHETSSLETLPPLNLGTEPQSSGPDVTTTVLDTCLTRATRIMQHQFRQETLENSNTSCELQEQDRRTNATGPALDVVIDTNKQSIDQVGTMLQCQCLQDGYLLTILSLIVFKVLDSYGAAASAPDAKKADADALEDDAQRMAAQRVLGELHRVQRLVNQLSIKIKSHTATGPQEKVPGVPTPCEQKKEGEAFLPFSTVMLSQLEKDMRKRLKGLCLGMAAYLRRD